MSRCNKAGLLALLAVAALCAHGALAGKCKVEDSNDVCDASGKPCADKACVDCEAGFATCKQCAGREARDAPGSFGEKDAYKPYALDAAKGTCVACDPTGDKGCDLAAGCALVAGAPVCLNCTAGYYSTGAVEGGVACAKCKGGCDDKGCDGSGVCLGACAEGFAREGDSCVPCAAEGCVKCTEPAQCEECSSGDLRYLDAQGNCPSLDTIDEWCGAATPDGKCTSCITGFRLTSAGGCEQCSGHKTSDGFERVDACQECPDAKEKCAVCSDGFRADNGACLECPEGCRNCTATECLTCSEGRMFDAAGKTCVECGNECMTCEAPGGPCTSCFWGEPDADGVCPASVESPPCDVEGCERCAEGDSNTCELCEPRSKIGFYSAVGGACVWTPFDLE